MDASSDANVRRWGEQAARRLNAGLSGGRCALVPIITASNSNQALRDIDTARAANADGVFLVNHGIGHQKLLRITQEALNHHRGFFVGINCRDLRPQDVFCRLPEGVGGVWVDDAGLLETTQDTIRAARIARHESGWQGLYLGGISLKGERQSRLSRIASLSASAQIDVITITGWAKTSEIPVEAVRQLRVLVQPRPLAIVASMRVGHMSMFLPYVDCLMPTAPSDSKSTHLNAHEIQQLVAQAHRPSKPDSTE